MKPHLALALLLTTLATASAAAAGPPVREVTVARARLLLGDVLPACAADVAALDLGPAPASGGSRLVTRDELRHAFEAASAKAPAWLPEAVRVVRKMQRLASADLDKLAHDALDAGPMPRGASLVHLAAPHGAQVAAGWDAVHAALPRPPHRTGPWKSVATLTFTAGAEVLTTLSVPVDLALGAEAAAFDLPKGGAVTLVVRHGLVEIEAQGMAAVDADVGAVLPVTLRPSGRVVRARLVTPDRAELVEGS
jgi:hypothetical protein